MTLRSAFLLLDASSWTPSGDTRRLVLAPITKKGVTVVPPSRFYPASRSKYRATRAPASLRFHTQTATTAVRLARACARVAKCTRKRSKESDKSEPASAVYKYLLGVPNILFTAVANSVCLLDVTGKTRRAPSPSAGGPRVRIWQDSTSATAGQA